MSSAFILFDNARNQVTLQSIADFLSKECQLVVRMAEWKGFATTVPQVHVGTRPTVALQLNSDADYVPEENAELVDSYGDSLDERSRKKARACSSRVEVMTCEATVVHDLPELGTLVSTPNLDTRSTEVRGILQQLSQHLDGWCFDNVNGDWIHP